MAISINAIALSDQLIIHDEFAQNAVGQSSRVKINGVRVVQNSPLLKRPEIVLGSQSIAGGFSGYFTRDQLIALKALEQAQTTVVFIHESQTFNVVIKAGGIDVVPILPRPNQVGTDWYTGTITMIEV